MSTEVVHIFKLNGWFASLQKKERLRASTQQTVHLWEGQNQQGLGVPYQDPNSVHEEEEGIKAVKNHNQGDLWGKLGMEVTFPHLRATETDGLLLSLLT